MHLLYGDFLALYKCNNQSMFLFPKVAACAVETGNARLKGVCAEPEGGCAQTIACARAALAPTNR
jgi:hypothetical protein